MESINIVQTSNEVNILDVVEVRRRIESINIDLNFNEVNILSSDLDKSGKVTIKGNFIVTNLIESKNVDLVKSGININTFDSPSDLNGI